LSPFGTETTLPTFRYAILLEYGVKSAHWHTAEVCKENEIREKLCMSKD
jgi:hypothetical protein